MRYVKAEWVHSLSNEPARFYFEIDEQKSVLRKIELFADGRAEFDDIWFNGGPSCIHSDWTDFDDNDEMALKPILQAEFETAWHEARAVGRKSRFFDRLSDCLTRLRGVGKSALITFVTAGDPSRAQSELILDALIEGGADIVELGMPFSDPMADGPSIQASSLRALGEGATLNGTLAQAAAFRARHPATPLILMGYLNPIFAHGAERFAADALAAGVDGVIVVDLPPEEAPDLAPHLARHGLHLIRLATPTTDAARLPAVLEGASGFLYYVSVAGITGAGAATADMIGAAVARLKAATDIPVAVGFGIRTPAQAAAVARAGADAVVVGSAIVDTIAAAHAARVNDIAGPVREQVAALAAAIRDARA